MEKRILGLGLIVWVLSVGIVNAAQPTCGGVLGKGVHNLKADLTCPGPFANDVALTLTDGAVLNCQGRTLSLDGSIILEGTGASLMRCTIQCATDFCFQMAMVYVLGDGGHRIVDNQVYGLFDGIGVFSDGNQLRRNQVVAGDSGITVDGRKNTVRMNTVTFPLVGLWVTGDKNKLQRNTIDATIGIYGSGDQNLFYYNTVTPGGDAVVGIWLDTEAEDNSVRYNIAEDFYVDAWDESDTCTKNDWRDNTFRITSPECLKAVTPEVVSEAR